jgi:hypothetical protein
MNALGKRYGRAKTEGIVACVLRLVTLKPRTYRGLLSNGARFLGRKLARQAASRRTLASIVGAPLGQAVGLEVAVQRRS